MNPTSAGAGRRAQVEEFLARTRAPIGAVALAVHVDISPDGERIAFTALVREEGKDDLVPYAAAVELATAEISRYGPGTAPRWSPDGSRLAWIGDQAVEFVDLRRDRARTRTCVPGIPEYVDWRPDGRALLVGVAEPGAARSDVDGSGLLPGAGDAVSGGPVVSTGEPPAGGRGLRVIDVGTGESAAASPAGVVVWQAAWAGPARIVCVRSADPSESGWYHGELALLDPPTGEFRAIAHPPGQVGLPASNAAGTFVSAVVGAMSDRGLYGGELHVFGVPGGAARLVDTAGVDVTSQHWQSETEIVFAGLRGSETVIGRHSIATGETQILRTSATTCGLHLPEIGVAAATVAFTSHGYGMAPALCVLTPEGTAEPRLSFADEGTGFLAAAGGRMEIVEWLAPDGERIEGFLATPPGPGPHPLVVNVHGGPVWAWRDEWSMHAPHTPLLVSQGYAVLHPNMRGSLGRGQKFILRGLRDMGGLDAADILSGVDALVAAGRADAARIGITGNSYGGFMSAWLVATSGRFAAAVARSPVTEWVSQHHTSNIPGFDRLCLTGDPLDPESDYRRRSPFYLAAQVRTPILLMAGVHDLATPPEQATMLHRALVERGRDSTLVVYPAEGHGVRAHAAVVDQCTRMLEFFDRHLGGAS